MNADRFAQLTNTYPQLHIGILGDFCLDRYLDIDPERAETSIETGLPVHNVVRVRAQPGAAGTILNNLAALGIGTLYPIGFCGPDGEGHELRVALQERRGVDLQAFLATPHRRTFTYCKPLIHEPGRPPRELSRLDSKNWTPTPAPVEDQLIAHLQELARRLDGLIVMDQVDLADTGVVTCRVLSALRVLVNSRPDWLIVADSRRGLAGFPPVCFKMNRSELAALTQATTRAASRQEVESQALHLAQRNRRHVFVTLAEDGIVGAAPNGQIVHSPALPLRGPIDIVGAGDAVTANLTAALAAGAALGEAVELANLAASIVIHQLGTTGTASVPQLKELAVSS